MHARRAVTRVAGSCKSLEFCGASGRTDGLAVNRGWLDVYRMIRQRAKSRVSRAGFSCPGDGTRDTLKWGAAGMPSRWPGRNWR
jgi:hypothetical protein